MTRVRFLAGAAALEPEQAEVLRRVLALQARVALGQAAEGAGFLATTWNLEQLRALLAEGAYLALAEAGPELRGYALMAPIRHLPAGAFQPEPGSPIRSRADLDGPRRFVYAYQIAVDPERRAFEPPASVQLMAALTAEHRRRGLHSLSCVLLEPRRNDLGLAFLAAMGLSRIGTLRAPQGPPLLPGPATWACMLKLPLEPTPDGAS